MASKSNLVFTYGAARSTELRLIFESSLKMIRYIPIQRLINPSWHRSTYPSREPVNPIENYRIYAHESCKEGENLSITGPMGRDVMWECARQKWDESESRKLVMKTFNNIPSEKLQQITKIIAFGGESFEKVFAWEPGYIITRFNQLNNKAANHLVIQDVREIIEGIHRQKVPDAKVESFVQDEAYTVMDRKKQLAGLQLEPLMDPDGYLRIDKNTLVFCLATKSAFLQVIADVAKATPPAMIFHTKIEEEEWDDYKPANRGERPPKGYLMDSTSPRVQAFIEQYEEADFQIRRRYIEISMCFSMMQDCMSLRGLGQNQPSHRLRLQTCS